MPIGNIRVFVTGTLSCALSLLALPLTARPAPAPTWYLPAGMAVKDSGSRGYRFTVDYTTMNATGEVVLRQRVSGDYTRGLPDGRVIWNNVTRADAQGSTSAFSTAQKSEFMEGFRYRNDLASTMDPEFFKGFPVTAVFERNLVWDTGMIEHFGQDFFGNLRLNEPYRVIADEDVHMPDVGTFHNHNVILEWVGQSRRSGHDCALISYQAFLNPLRITNSGMTLKGRSDYWGEIWVSLATKQIEYATINEDVIGEMQLAGQETTQLISVLRSGVFEPALAH